MGKNVFTDLSNSLQDEQTCKLQDWPEEKSKKASNYWMDVQNLSPEDFIRWTRRSLGLQMWEKENN